jgi:hypothetical protein
MSGLIKNPTQSEKILAELIKADGQWVNGRRFCHVMMISQYHARIKELQGQDHKIEASTFKDEYGFKSYRIVPVGRLF